MQELSRRTFVKDAMSSLLTFSLLETLYKNDLFAAAIKPVTDRWVKEVDQISRDLRGHEIEQDVWQKKIEELFSRIDLTDLLRFIDFDRLTKKIEFPDDRAETRDVSFPKVKGMPAKFSFIGRIFALAKGRAIVPHGHQNMVSGHLIIKGEMRVRHYERVQDEPGHLIIRPTIDRNSIPGDATTISDGKDNVHWLRATSETAFTFDVIVPDLNPADPTRIDFIDPEGGDKLKDGLIRARRIEAVEAFKIYGRS
jgi:hypothetical protein